MMNGIQFDLSVFTLTQGSILQFWTPSSLRGYGCGTPNGSLWTIPITVQFYLLAFCCREFLKNKGAHIWVLVMGISLIFGAGSHLLNSMNFILIGKLYNVSIFQHLWLFLLGVSLSEFKDSLFQFVVKHWYSFIGISIVFYIVKCDIPFLSYRFIFSMLSIYGLIGLAYRYPSMNIRLDISYGLYIYHMVIVNIMMMLGMVNDIKYLSYAMIASIISAYFSTKFVGNAISRLRFLLVK